MSSISSISKIKYTVVDSKILPDKYGYQFFIEYISNKLTKNHQYLILEFPGTEDLVVKVKAFMEVTLEQEIKVIQLENKKNGIDAATILNYFAAIEDIDLGNIKLPDKIDFGKKIVYLSSKSNSYINKFKRSAECPGFLEGGFGFGCPHECSWCFLRVTARIRPFVTIYCNFEKLEKNFQSLQKKGNKRRINTGEKNDILAITPLIPSYCKIMLELAKKYNQKLLFMTKSCNVDTIPEKNGYNAIFGFSIDNPEGIETCQSNTASYNQRLSAAKDLVKKGYKVVWRYDPIHIDEAFKSFFLEGKKISVTTANLSKILSIIDDISKICNYSLVLGTYRGYTQLDNFMQIKLPVNWREIFELEEIQYEGKKKPAIRVKYPRSLRGDVLLEVYNHAAEKGFKNIHICKDSSFYKILGKGPCVCNLP
jgi:hypothetical protein